MWSIEEIAKLIKDVPDFPKKGILFKDITPVLSHHEAFVSLTRQFVRAIDPSVTHLAAIESRGFILGAAIAQHMNVGFLPVRKPGKLPRETYAQSYQLEYGEDTLEIHKDDLKAGDRVAIIDDVLATGGTAAATEALIKKTGATVLESHFLMEIEFLRGRDRLEAPVKSFMKV
ncbi:MAG: adenine phosphoribosyltransferase [Bdellovibrionaceae bacterium]|nr:adenine phosphoribosyltransferase [Pseudobdellovibrionaceae bacterium]